MKAFVLALGAAAFVLSACTTSPEQNTILGAVGGAAVGHAVSGSGDKTKGALIGAAIGAVAGTMIGQANQAGKCYYADGRGGTYIGNC